jgi:hypothetical protein
MGEAAAQSSGFYTKNMQEVVDSEKSYINTRRDKNNLKNLSDYNELWGICFSGGGIRSATLCLGIMQKLIRKDIFRFFDYLSTVSGGGYIGSCLTSLLSNPKECYLKTNEIEVEPGVEPGVELNTSPFTGLNKFDDYKNEAATRLSVRHQIHHLRTHGEYLMSRKEILSRDVQRAVGSLFTGILHHLILFSLALIALTALVHLGLFTITQYPAENHRKLITTDSPAIDAPFLLELNYSVDTYYKIDKDVLIALKAKEIPKDKIIRLLPLEDKVFYKGRQNFLKSLSPIVKDKRTQELILKLAGNPRESQAAYVINEIRTWLFARLGVPLYHMLYDGFKSKAWHYLISFCVGIVFCLFSYSLIGWIKNRIYDSNNNAIETAKSGFNLEDHYESNYVLGLNLASFVIITIGIVLYGIWNSSRPDPQGNHNYLSALFLPLGFALGTGVASLIFSNLARSFKLKEDRIRRSLYNAVQGSSFYSIIFSMLIPFSLVFLFSINYFKPKFWWSLVSLALSYCIFKTSGQGKKVAQILAKFYKFLLSFFLLLFIALAYNSVSDFLISQVYPNSAMAWFSINWVLLVVFLISTLIMVIFGYLVNSNRISPHYFYRDRLTEAYLKTDARINRSESHEKKRQGRPLVSVRNHENLKLSQLGENNNRGPYHIIVTALNLQGSDELNRKTMLSEHFIFSKYYVGSRITGYVKTAQYRDNETKLARAMTISAAAAGSAMGLYSFTAQAFATTLFNVRLGYWMANPWFYLKGNENPEPMYPFWPKWLMLEMLNKTTARDKMVNLSDGGHTGDNLGLLPLLQRRCKVIFICDGEADADYKFESFNNAVRMAYIEQNIEIEIDLSDIIPEKEKDGSYKMSKKSVAFGKIIYPPVDENAKEAEGKLIYLKSSLSAPKQQKMPLPVHVNNYYKGHPDFPHQTTADQFFDDAQFEAYRALGEYIAEQAVDEYSIISAGYT